MSKKCPESAQEVHACMHACVHACILGPMGPGPRTLGPKGPRALGPRALGPKGPWAEEPLGRPPVHDAMRSHCRRAEGVDNAPGCTTGSDQSFFVTEMKFVVEGTVRSTPSATAKTVCAVVHGGSNGPPSTTAQTVCAVAAPSQKKSMEWIYRNEIKCDMPPVSDNADSLRCRGAPPKKKYGADLQDFENIYVSFGVPSDST